MIEIIYSGPSGSNCYLDDHNTMAVLVAMAREQASGLPIYIRTPGMTIEVTQSGIARA